MWILKIFACGARSARGSTPSTPVFEKFWHGGGGGGEIFSTTTFSSFHPLVFLHEKTNVANRPKQKPMSSTGFYTPCPKAEYANEYEFCSWPQRSLDFEIHGTVVRVVRVGRVAVE